MQVMDPRAVDLSQRAREEVGLLLIVAFETDAIAGQDDFLQQRNDRVGIDDLARQPSAETRRGTGQTSLATLRALVPDPRRRRPCIHRSQPITQFGNQTAIPGNRQIKMIATNIRPTNGITPQTTSRSGMSGA